MAQRKQITLIYSYNDNWIGGTYYILNIIRALVSLEDELKPELLILHSTQSPVEPIENINYPYITYKKFDLKLSPIKRALNKVFFHLNGKMVFQITLPLTVGDNVYPLTSIIDKGEVANGFYWIADLQDYFLPEFFTAKEIRFRRKIHEDLVKRALPLVFSSRTSLDDFNKFYPSNQNTKKVLNFASFIDDSWQDIDIKTLKDNFLIDKKYFIVSNQFWKHKNHIVVLEAIKRLKDMQEDFQVVFTGKEYDHRNPDYFNTLKRYIDEHGLDSYVKFLGFIDRQDQLCLMNGSVSIIQPSLFEGWSTVVEDAKVLNKFIIVSNISLHKEQISLNCSFFNPNDAEDLAIKMIEALEADELVIPNDYSYYQRKFALDFMEIFNNDK